MGCSRSRRRSTAGPAATARARRPDGLGVARRRAARPIRSRCESRRAARPGRRGFPERCSGASCRCRASRRRTTHVVDPLPARVRLVAAPGELRGVELEVLGWRTWTGELMLRCRLVDGSVGDIPAAWSDLPRRVAPPAALGVLGSPAAWRLFAERLERVRSRPVRGGASGANRGGGRVGVVGAGGERGARGRGGGVGDAAAGCPARGDGAPRAVVYVRQSTLAQVERNVESAARQYALRERAVELGWPPQSVVVVDEDLGRSGASSDGRFGFKELVAEVGLGHVGLVLASETSRLARSSADWHQLLDLCALTQTLIADADGIYSPGEFNDRLLLGLKGTMSEAELHLIRSRLRGGLENKARRGELRLNLPVGLERDEDDRIRLATDEQVRAAIAHVYATWRRCGSARQVVSELAGEGQLLPRRTVGERRIRWEPASFGAVHDLLTNPTYAGAFVFGPQPPTQDDRSR